VHEYLRNTRYGSVNWTLLTHKLIKRITNVKFVELRKIHYNVMSRVMDMNEADSPIL